MNERGRLAAVREATEHVREGMLANARGEQALDMGAALTILCDAVDKLAEAIAPPCDARLDDGAEVRRCEFAAGHAGDHRATTGPSGYVLWGGASREITNAGEAGGKEHRCT